ncbi:MAG: MFS transporter, partial [Candidatus Nanopelagicales bacterium]
GFSLAGVLLFTIGPVPAILFNAATFGVSALLLVGVKGGRQPPDPEPPIERSRRALRAATRNPLLRRVLAIVLLLAFADAAVNALLPVFVRTNDYSPLLLTALAVTAPLVGALSGSVVPRDGANLYLLRISAKFTVVGGGGAAVLLLLIGSGATARGALVAMMAIVAFGVTIAADIPTMTAAMRAVDDDLRAPLVAVVQPALMGIQAVGALAAGAAAVLIPATSAMAAALLLPVGYGLWVLLRPVEDQATIDLTQATAPPPSRVTLDVADQHARSKTGDDFVS